MDYIFQVLEEVKTFINSGHLSLDARESLEQAFYSIISHSSVPAATFHGLSLSNVIDSLVEIVRDGKLDISNSSVNATFRDIEHFLTNELKKHSSSSSNSNGELVAAPVMSHSEIVFTPIKTAMFGGNGASPSPSALRVSPAARAPKPELDIIEELISDLFSKLCSRFSGFIQSDISRMPPGSSTDRRSIENITADPESESFTISLGTDAIISCIKRLEDGFKVQNRALKEKLGAVADDYFALQRAYNESMTKDSESRAQVLQVIQSLLPLQYQLQKLVQDARGSLQREKTRFETCETRRQIAVRELKIVREKLQSSAADTALTVVEKLQDKEEIVLTNELVQEWENFLGKLPQEEADYLTKMGDRTKLSFLKLWENFTFEFTKEREEKIKIEEELEKSNSKILEFEARLNELSQSVQSTVDVASDSKAEVATLSMSLSLAEKKTLEKEKELTQLVSLLEESKAEVSRLNGQIVALQANNSIAARVSLIDEEVQVSSDDSEMAEMVKSLTLDLKNAAEEFEKLQLRFNEKDSLAQEWEAKSKEYQLQIELLNVEKIQLESNLKSMSAQLEESVSSPSASINTAQEVAAAKISDSEEARIKEIETLKNDIFEWTMKCEALQSSLHAKESQFSHQVEALNSLEKDYETLSSQLMTVVKEKDSANETLDNVKSNYRKDLASKDKRYNELLGTLNGLEVSKAQSEEALKAAKSELETKIKEFELNESNASSIIRETLKIVHIGVLNEIFDSVCVPTELSNINVDSFLAVMAKFMMKLNEHILDLTRKNAAIAVSEEPEKMAKEIEPSASVVAEYSNSAPLAEMDVESKSESVAAEQTKTPNVIRLKTQSLVQSAGTPKSPAEASKNPVRSKTLGEITDLPSSGNKRKIDEVELEKKKMTTPFKMYRTSEDKENSDEERGVKKSYGLMLTGFRDGIANNFERRSQLVAKLNKIIPECAIYDNFDKRVTHVIVADAEVATLKAQLGLVTGRWIMNVKWLEDSLSKGRFVDESNYGSRRAPYPLSGKKIFYSRNFIMNQHEANLKSFDQIIQYAQGIKTVDIKEADIILVHREDNISGSANENAHVVTKDEFIRLIGQIQQQQAAI